MNTDKYFVKHIGTNWQHAHKGVITEIPVSLTVNGELWLTFMCTPNYLEALAVGFLYNEGIISSLVDIATVRLCESGDNIDVWLNIPVTKPTNWIRTSGCTGGFSISDELKNIKPELNGVSIGPNDIKHLMRQLLESQELHQQVGGVHTSGLSDGDQTLLICEDVGRHNTLDKLAGRCLLENVQLKQKILLTTGRISSEMLQKSARIGAAIVISHTAATSLAIELAEKWGITLIGYARRDRFNIYTYPDRILAAPKIDSPFENKPKE